MLKICLMLFNKWCLSKSCSKIITNVHCISSLYCTAQIKPMFRPYETNLPYLSLLWSAQMNPMYRTNDQRICTGIGKLMCRTYHSMFSPNESNVQKQWNICTDVLKLMCQIPHPPPSPPPQLKFSIKHFYPISKRPQYTKKSLQSGIFEFSIFFCT